MEVSGWENHQWWIFQPAPCLSFHQRLNPCKSASLSHFWVKKPSPFKSSKSILFYVVSVLYPCNIILSIINWYIHGTTILCHVSHVSPTIRASRASRVLQSASRSATPINATLDKVPMLSSCRVMASKVSWLKLLLK